MSKTVLTVAILVISTTAARDPSTDSSGGILNNVFKEVAIQWEVVDIKITGDVVLDIQRTITQWTDQETPVNLIVTTGGTGFAIFDNTPEAVSHILHRHAPGLVHGMLAASLAVTPFALMSRPVAGIRNKTVIITLPGSPKGAKENLQSILKLLPHACLQAAGTDSRALHAGGIKKLEADAGVGTAINSSHSLSNDHSHNHSHFHSHEHAMPVRHTPSGDQPLSNEPGLGPSRRYRESPYPMLSVEDALNLIERHSLAPKAARVAVNSSLVGSVLAESIIAEEAIPAYRASIVDGYAVVAPEGGSGTKGVFPVVSISHAAPGEILPIKSGEITRITTGGALPPGANAVVMVEDTVLKTMTDDGTEEKEVEILADDIKPGENIREVGSDIQAGSTVLQKGEEISAIGGEVGLLASIGKTEVLVYKKPVVGVLSTGDEIVQHDRPGQLRLGEVRDSNRPAVMAVVQSWGFEVVDLGIAHDTSGALEDKLRDAFRRVDVVVTTGGVSMGELDLLKPTIERSFGGTIHFGRVEMKPGKPTTFATVTVKNNDGERVSKVIFSLPGNPASAIVTLHIFVLPSLHYSSGVSPPGLPRVIVTAAHDFALDNRKAEFHRAVLMMRKDGILYASSTGGQRSSRVGSLKSANALLCLPKDTGTLPKGSKMEALLMGKMPASVSYRSFNDITISAEGTQVISPAEDPYIYTPFVAKTIPTLLRIEDHLPPEERCNDYVIKFPSNLAHYDRTEAGNHFQWLSQGYYGGILVGHLISRFALTDGVTFRDQGMIAQAILQRRLVELWRQEFANRGMPWTRYVSQARLIGERIGVGILEPVFWNEVGFSRYVRQEDAAENM